QARTHGERTDGYTSAHETCRIGHRPHHTLRGRLQVRIYIFYKFRINICVFNYSHFLSPSLLPAYFLIFLTTFPKPVWPTISPSSATTCPRTMVYTGIPFPFNTTKAEILFT